MKATKAIALMKEAELKQLSIKDSPTTILQYINAGVTEIYKKFPLWYQDATITMAAGTTLYKLDGTDGNVAISLDEHQFLMIEELYDEDDKYYLQSDEQHHMNAERMVKIPRHNYLRFHPDAVEAGYVVDVRYRAAPLDLADDTETIDLPIQFMECLYLFCAYKAQMSLKSGGDRDLVNAAWKRFEAACARVKFDGAVTTEHLEGNKFAERGFV